MAEKPKTICEWLDIELDNLSEEDKLNLIDEICDTLTIRHLICVQELAGIKRVKKFEGAKQQAIKELEKEKELEEKFKQIGLPYDEGMGVHQGRRSRRNSRSILPPRYRSPKGETWSGQGYPPQWMRDLEEAGHDRTDYRITEEG
jgi:DNA-binding protein H-NS